MNNFIYENKTKVYFGQGCVKEFLTCLVRDYDTVMMAYGQGSIKKNGIYDEILNILMKEDKNVVEFPGIMPNSTFRKVMEGGTYYAKQRSRDDPRHRRGLCYGLLQGDIYRCPLQRECLGELLGEKRNY